MSSCIASDWSNAIPINNVVAVILSHNKLISHFWDSSTWCNFIHTEQTLSFLFFDFFFFVRIFDSLSGVADHYICPVITRFVSNTESDDSLSFTPLIPTYPSCVISDIYIPTIRKTATTPFFTTAPPSSVWLFSLYGQVSLSCRLYLFVISTNPVSCVPIYGEGDLVWRLRE